MGEFFIPVSEIAAYCQLYGISDVCERTDFAVVVSAVDMHLLAKRQEEKKAAT